MEAIAAFAAFADKLTVKDVIHKIVNAEKLSPYLIDRIMSRLDVELPPFINAQGTLEFPYLDQLERMGGGPLIINN